MIKITIVFPKQLGIVHSQLGKTIYHLTEISMEIMMRGICFVLSRLLHGAHGVLYMLLHIDFAEYYKTNQGWLMVIKGATKLTACSHWMSLY